MTNLLESPNGSARLLELPVAPEPGGDMACVEWSNHVPFDIARVSYLYNVLVDSERGGYAHKMTQEVVLAISGSFRLKIDDGVKQTEFWLRNPRQGVLIDRLIWREMDSFSHGAICLMLASHPYEKTDYIRDYKSFKQEVIAK